MSSKLQNLPAASSMDDNDVMYEVAAPATTPVDKKITWATIKSILKTYFDGIYQAALGFTPANAATAVTLTGVQEITNKRRTRRVVTTTQSATPAINTDVTDMADITGLAQAVTSMTTNLTGTPEAGDLLEVDFTDNGTPRAIAWGASFADGGITKLPLITVASTRLKVYLAWSTVTSKWECVGTG